MARFAALDHSELSRPVPACPNWDVGALVDHVAWAQRYWAAVLLAPEGSTPAIEAIPRRPAGNDPVLWFNDAGQHLQAALRHTPASKPITWQGTVRPASFVLRRTAHELAIHRWDAESALGQRHDLDPQLAIDGIEEYLDLWLPT
ncbi:MAG: maleylpyruvate isomerase family mycothiol-dependent enzyme, partial [Vicinamibacterales bacterium]